MTLQLLFFQVVIMRVLSTNASSKDISKIGDLPKLKVKDLQSGIHNVDDLIEAIRSSLNSEEKVKQETKAKRDINRNVHREFETDIKTPVHNNKLVRERTKSITLRGKSKLKPHNTYSSYATPKGVTREPYAMSKTHLFGSKNRVSVPNKRHHLDTYASHNSHEYESVSSLSVFDKDAHELSQEVRYNYNPDSDPSFNLEVSEIVDATFIVPEGYDLPLPVPAAPATSYNLRVNDGTVSRNEFRKDNGEFALSYTSADGTTRSERGTLVRGSSGMTLLVLSGSYSYISPDGRRFRVDYTADERGYRAVTVPDYDQHGTSIGSCML